MMHKLTIEDVSFKGKTVFVRVDFNVPLDEDGTIVADTRIRAALPTINHLIDEGARIIIASHLGRPKGIVNHKYSLKPVHKRLERLLGKQGEIAFAPDCVGPQVRELAEKLGPGPDPAAGEPALPQGGDRQRPGVRQGARRGVRRLRQRRLRHRPPRPRLHGRRRGATSRSRWPASA